jgi:triphosphatase
VAHVERELKFSLVEAPPAPAVVVALGRGGPYAFVEAGVATHVDRYFDDDGGRLGAAGWALRQRRSPEGLVATLKSGGEVDGGWHRREELEAPMEGSDWPTALARRLAVHVALWQLRPRLELEVERSRYHVVYEGRPLATLTFDRVTARLPAGARTVHFDEVEIEALGAGEAEEERALLQGAAALLDDVVHLTPTPVTKLERAAAALALDIGP